MAYRFTSTDKWTDTWFSELTPLQMLLFIYLCDNCDIAGFINVNIKRWASDLNSTKPNIEGALKGLKRGLVYSNDGEVIFLKNFLKHQKNLPINENNKAHIGIVKRFNEYKNRFGVENPESLLSLENEGGSKGLGSPIGIGNGIGNGKELDQLKTFSFKQSLINSGANEQHVADLMAARSKKHLANTETALKLFISQAGKLNMTIPEAVEYCAGRSWGGLRVEYVQKETPTNTFTGQDEADMIEYINNLSEFDWSVAKSKLVFDETNSLFHPGKQKYIGYDTLTKCGRLMKYTTDIFRAKSLTLTPATYGKRSK